MTPKAIANKIKAKGLQKLRWYCQMCNKQCRDENGFQCHLKSDSHMRQMALFGQNSEKIIGEYSRQFETTFLQHFRTAHRHTRMQASMLYNEFIADRHHVHMNSTKVSRIRAKPRLLACLLACLLFLPCCCSPFSSGCRSQLL